MSIYTISIIALLSIIVLIAIVRLLNTEETIIRKAEDNCFYHVLAKLTCAKYNGYKLSEEEKKAVDEYMSRENEYDKHPIGGYFYLREILKDTLSTCGQMPKVNMNEMAIGLAVMGAFAIVVTLGVLL